jgi:hypothetical protein
MVLALDQCVPRTAQNAPGGIIYHLLNHANGRLRLFASPPVIPGAEVRIVAKPLLERRTVQPAPLAAWVIDWPDIRFFGARHF